MELDSEFDQTLAALEQRVKWALQNGDDAGALPVVGYGEISPVLRLTTSGGGAYAVKRLPPFSEQARAQAYAETFERYRAALVQAGLRVLDTKLVRTESGALESSAILYCVQPLLSPEQLCANYLRKLAPSVGRELGRELIDRVEGVVGRGATGGRIGLDAQISNWYRAEGELGYLDLTTPLLRSPSGHELLDTDVFLASLPYAMRGFVRRFVLGSVLANYYDLRSVLLDLLGNLLKEGLSHHLSAWLALASERVTPALTSSEVHAHYRQDARIWGSLQLLRRLDRSWQTRVRRRSYSFLLPARIERRVG